MTAAIEDFRTRGEFLQTMTLDFANGVPDEHRVYASLAGFETPLGWRLEWGL